MRGYISRAKWTAAVLAATVAGSLLLSACGGGGGGGTPAPRGALTGISSLATSATSRVARQSVGNLALLQQLARQPRFGGRSASVSRGRQAIEYDEELGVYYRLQMNPESARIEFFADASGQDKIGEFAYLERPGSYELMVRLEGDFEMYYKLAETSAPNRLKLRARFADLQTEERCSIDGDVEVAARRGRQYDDDYDWEDDFDWDDWGGDETDWYDDYDWWNDSDDFFFGDDYTFDESEYFNDEEFFVWEGDEEFDYQPGVDTLPVYDDIGDFEITRFEGEITYEGCGRSLRLVDTILDYATGRLTGTIQVDSQSGSVDYNIETGQGQITLSSAQGQVRIVFRGDEVEAIYPDGRRERVNLSQWADPCAGVGDGTPGDDNQDDTPGGDDGGQIVEMSVSSDAFSNGGYMPRKYASTEVGGQNLSPPLSWTNVPAGTRSFVIVCIDLDADNFVHWVVYDIPASVTSIPEGATFSAPAKLGRNDADGTGYFGPEPPPNEDHRYQFTIYALSVESLGLPEGATLQQVENALQGKVRGVARIVGKFRVEQ
ncbi:MAG: YbhB/YbcL family Raf kinase inhibitor-like protein [Fimbriimonadales bacterium]|nr:YbhB/YbcL family Raf kinase inhibitor-like protein [Fimbriimonadales bacterium]